MCSIRQLRAPRSARDTRHALSMPHARHARHTLRGATADLGREHFPEWSNQLARGPAEGRGRIKKTSSEDDRDPAGIAGLELYHCTLLYTTLPLIHSTIIPLHHYTTIPLYH